MKKLMIYLDQDVHEDLRELAHRKRTTMAALIRAAIDDAYEDELDIIAGERALEEAARDPESSMSWEEYRAQRAGDVQDRDRKGGAPGARTGTEG